MNDLVERMRKCSERVSKSKFPDYHAACWLEKGADRIEALEAVLCEIPCKMLMLQEQPYDECFPLEPCEPCHCGRALAALKKDEE